MAIDTTLAEDFRDSVIALIEGHDADLDDLVILREALTQSLRVLGCTMRKYSLDQVGANYDGYVDMTDDLAALKTEISTILGV